MDELDTLDISVEHLIKEIKVTYEAKATGSDYDGNVDFEEELTSVSYETVTEAMIELLATKPRRYETEIWVTCRRALQIPLLDSEYDLWEFKEFSHVEKMPHLSERDVKNHPIFKKKAEEKAAAKKAKKEAEQKQWREDNRRRELEIYERLKKELENGDVGA